MVREIIHDPVFLAIKSAPATDGDVKAALDLLDTLIAHREGCLGMAANMIGINKRIIAFDCGDAYMTMFNPEIIKGTGAYTTEESCLSLTGSRKCRRFRSVKVKWQDEHFKTRIKTFDGLPAQIIQHEIDHCDGILI